MSEKIRIVEVGPRDGLQSQDQILPTSIKVEWIERLLECGLEEIEVGAFVRPDLVPAMANSDEVIQALQPAQDHQRRWVLVPNLRGLKGAREAGAREFAFFTAASDTFSIKNTGCTIEESLERLEQISGSIAPSGEILRGYISTCFGCPYEGDVSVESVKKVARSLLRSGVEEVVISDTTGIATPEKVEMLLDSLADDLPVEKTTLHLHDTGGLACTNAVAGLGKGVRSFDAASGGIGGCPFAPGAAGNVATEDLITEFEKEGIETGIDRALLIETSLWLEQHLPDPLPARALDSARKK